MLSRGIIFLEGNSMNKKSLFYDSWLIQVFALLMVQVEFPFLINDNGKFEWQIPVWQFKHNMKNL